MKIKQGFSYLRLIYVLLAVGFFVGLLGGLATQNGGLATFGVICLSGGVLVRLIRFMYRD